MFEILGVSDLSDNLVRAVNYNKTLINLEALIVRGNSIIICTILTVVLNEVP